MAILAKFRHFPTQIAPYVEISIILAGFYVEKSIIFLKMKILTGTICVRRYLDSHKEWEKLY